MQEAAEMDRIKKDEARRQLALIWQLPWRMEQGDVGAVDALHELAAVSGARAVSLNLMEAMMAQTGESGSEAQSRRFGRHVVEEAVAQGLASNGSLAS